MEVEKHDAVSPFTTKPAHLPEELGMYVDALAKKHDGVDQVWILGGPGPADPQAKWELLLFADERRLEAIRADSGARRGDVDLLIVVDGDRFESAWGGRRARLSDLRWRLDGAQAATYRRPSRELLADDEVAVAHRVR